MRNSFEPYWPLYVEVEGDTLDMDRRDPGNWTGGKVGVGRLGGTKYGIDTASHPGEDISNMTDARAREIIHAKYAPPIFFDDLPAGLDIEVLDESVNAGPKQATRDLQRAVGVEPDGAFGHETMTKATLCDPVPTIKRLADFRLTFYRSLTNLYKTYGVGWSRRVAKVEALGVTLAMQFAGSPTATIETHHETEVAKHEQDARDAGTSATIGGGAAAGGAGASNTPTFPADQTFHLPQGTTMVILAAVAVVIVVYFVWQRTKSKARAQAFAQAARGL
jgi:lysozyme family protein